MKAVAIAFIWVTLLAGLTSPDLAQAAPLPGQQQEQGELEKLKALLREQQKQIEGLKAQAGKSSLKLDSLKDLQDKSTLALNDAGITTNSLAALMNLYQLRGIEKCLVKYQHWAYVNAQLYPIQRVLGDRDRVIYREGFMLLLGTRDNKVMGLTTRCGVDAIKDILVDVPTTNETGGAILAGVLALQLKGEESSDLYFVEHETKFDHEYVQKPSKFDSPFLKNAGLTTDAWTDLLNSGKRIRVKGFGNNDLALVTFDRKKRLGIKCKPILGGVEPASPSHLRVEQVADESPAASARIKEGDLISAIDRHQILLYEQFRKRDVFKQKDDESKLRLGQLAAEEWVDTILAECKFNEAIPVQLLRTRPVSPSHAVVETVTKYLVFEHPGDFISDGKVSHLGVKQPDKVLDVLLGELDKLAILKRDFYVNCSWCVARDQAIKRKQVPPPSSIEKLAAILDIIAFATGMLGIAPAALVSAGTAAVIRNVKRAAEVGAELARRFEAAYQIGSEIQRGVEAAKDFGMFMAEKYTLGEPMEFDPQKIAVITGDSFEGEDLKGVNRKVRLAYVDARGESSKKAFEQLIVVAITFDLIVVAVPDGVDRHGFTHAHVFAIKDGDRVRASNLGELAVSTLVYLNMLVLMSGEDAQVFNHNVAGSATGFALKGLSRLSELKKR